MQLKCGVWYVSMKGMGGISHRRRIDVIFPIVIHEIEDCHISFMWPGVAHTGLEALEYVHL